VTGTSEMLRTYHNAVMQTRLTGPTYFEPILRRFLGIVKEQNKIYAQLYYILVILTDGCIHDMAITKSLVVEMSYLPISIIIVGIGDENFAMMEELDADKVVLKTKEGYVAARDICQFVRFSRMHELAKVEVAEHLLQEVPHHFVDYMVLKTILEKERTTPS